MDYETFVIFGGLVGSKFEDPFTTLNIGILPSSRYCAAGWSKIKAEFLQVAIVKVCVEQFGATGLDLGEGFGVLDALLDGRWTSGECCSSVADPFVSFVFEEYFGEDCSAGFTLRSFGDDDLKR